MNLENFAFNTLKSLQEDPRRYRNFGAYWYLVKAVMKRFYGRDNLHLLGDYIDRSVADRIPQHANLDEALQAAVQTYNQNAKFNLLSARVVDPQGEEFTLADEDAAGL
jgi:hypothetical protein